MGTKTCFIKGTAGNIDTAKQMLQKVVNEAVREAFASKTSRKEKDNEQEHQVEVPNEVVGAVIGEGGEKIRDLSTQAGVRMTFSREINAGKKTSRKEKDNEQERHLLPGRGPSG